MSKGKSALMLIGGLLAVVIGLAVRLALGTLAVFGIVNVVVGSITGVPVLGIADSLTVFCGLDILAWLLLSDLKKRGSTDA